MPRQHLPLADGRIHNEEACRGRGTDRFSILHHTDAKQFRCERSAG